jgi:hypothetical protein
MAGLRHDAKECRSKAKSELIRVSLGIELPEETAKRIKREDARRKAEAKAVTKGPPLLDFTK